MGRPTKETLDYIQLPTNRYQSNPKYLVLKNRRGKDGVHTFEKLESIIGQQKGVEIDLSDNTILEFLTGNLELKGIEDLNLFVADLKEIGLLIQTRKPNWYSTRYAKEGFELMVSNRRGNSSQKIRTSVDLKGQESASKASFKVQNSDLPELNPGMSSNNASEKRIEKKIKEKKTPGSIFNLKFSEEQILDFCKGHNMVEKNFSNAIIAFKLNFKDKIWKDQQDLFQHLVLPLNLTSRI